MTFKSALLIVLVAGMCCSASAQVQDFSINTSGPHHVVQGHYMFFLAQGKILAGTDKPGTVPSISGLPADATAEFVNMVRYCCVTSMYSLEDNNPVKISTASTTPVGTYPITLTYKTAEGVQRSTTYTLYVDALPSLTQKSGTYFPPDTPLASLQQWNANMVTYGRKHCTTDEMALWEGFVWYYDGTRVFYQIADATNDPSWNACAVMVANFYQNYVLTNNGTQGWRVFPQGLAMNYQRRGDPLSRQTVALLAQGGYAKWPNPAFDILWNLSREVSYGIEANLVEQSLGGSLDSHFQDQIEILLGHFDQWFTTKNTDYTQPFMVALAAEALIKYWDFSHDPRIPPILQTAADMLWTQSWDAPSQSFRYYNTDGTSYLTADLNLLIAPLYGWVYHQTGFKGYRDQGDQIFNGGVAGAWLDGGKQFSQSYRWSGQYVQWRSSPPAANPTQLSTVRSCDQNADGVVNVLDVQLGTNQALGTAACTTGDLNGDASCTIVDVMRIVNTSLGASCNTAP